MLQLARVRVKYRGRGTFLMALSAEAVYSKYQQYVLKLKTAEVTLTACKSRYTPSNLQCTHFYNPYRITYNYSAISALLLYPKQSQQDNATVPITALCHPLPYYAPLILAFQRQDADQSGSKKTPFYFPNNFVNQAIF